MKFYACVKMFLLILMKNKKKIILIWFVIVQKCFWTKFSIFQEEKTSSNLLSEKSEKLRQKKLEKLSKTKKLDNIGQKWFNMKEGILTDEAKERFRFVFFWWWKAFWEFSTNKIFLILALFLMRKFLEISRKFRIILGKNFCNL